VDEVSSPPLFDTPRWFAPAGFRRSGIPRGSIGKQYWFTEISRPNSTALQGMLGSERYLFYLVNPEPENEQLKNIDLCDQKTAP